MCEYCASAMVDTEAETSCGTCTYVDESCICGHHVSNDFCTPVICSGSEERKFWGRALAQKSFSYCVVATDWNYYSYRKGQPSLFQWLITPGWTRRLSPILFVYGCSACWSLCCDDESNFDTRKLLVYHFSLSTAATPFNFPIVKWCKDRFNYIIIIGGLNVGDFI